MAAFVFKAHCVSLAAPKPLPSDSSTWKARTAGHSHRKASPSPSSSSIFSSFETVSAFWGANDGRPPPIPGRLNGIEGHSNCPRQAYGLRPPRIRSCARRRRQGDGLSSPLSAHSHFIAQSAPIIESERWNGPGAEKRWAQPLPGSLCSPSPGRTQSCRLSGPSLRYHPHLVATLGTVIVPPKQLRVLSTAGFKPTRRSKLTSSDASLPLMQPPLSSTFVGRSLVSSPSRPRGRAQSLLRLTSMASIAGTGSLGTWPHDHSEQGSFPTPSETEHLIPSGRSDLNMGDQSSRDLENGGQVMSRRKRRLIAGIDQSELFQPVDLAEADSRFVDFLGVKLHYKVAAPHGGSGGDSPPAGRVAEPPASTITSQLEDIQVVVDGRGSRKKEEGRGEAESRANLGNTLSLGPMVSTAGRGGSHTAAVLLHGFGASIYSWQKVLHPIAQMIKAPALAFDRPAFGLTARVFPPVDMNNNDDLSSSPYSTAFSAAATLALASNLLVAQKSVLIAHSAGSLVALDAYFRAPELCAAIVLVAPALLIGSTRRQKSPPPPASTASSPLPGRHSESTSQQLGNQEVRPIARTGNGAASRDGDRDDMKSANGTSRGSMKERFHMLLVWITCVMAVFMTFCKWIWGSISRASTRLLLITLRSAFGLWLVRFAVDKFGDNAVKTAWHDVSACDEGVLANYKKPLKCRDWDKALIEFATSMALQREEVPPLQRRLQDIKCPVLVISGDDDRIVPEWNSRRVAEAIPVAEYRLLADCGHCPQEEKPQEFLCLLQAFFKEKLDIQPNLQGDKPRQQHLGDAQVTYT